MLACWRAENVRCTAGIRCVFPASSAIVQSINFIDTVSLNAASLLARFVLPCLCLWRVAVSVSLAVFVCRVSGE